MSSMNLKDLSLDSVMSSAFSEVEDMIIKKATDLGLALSGLSALEVWGYVMGFNSLRRGCLLEFVSFDKTASEAFLKWLELSVDPTKVKVEVTLVKSHKFDESYTKSVQGFLVLVPEYLVISKSLKPDVKNVPFLKCLIPVCDFDLLEFIAGKLKLKEQSYVFLNSVTDALNRRLITDSKNTGCLMLSVEAPYLREVRGLIDVRDLHKDGVELDTHVTIAYGFDTGVYPTFDSLCINSTSAGLTALITGVSFFENSEYDVCKLDVLSPSLTKLNAWLKDNVGFTSTYDKYIPHVTVAYLKPGMAKKYKPLVEDLVNTLKFPAPVAVGSFFYSAGMGSVVSTPSDLES